MAGVIPLGFFTSYFGDHLQKVENKENIFFERETETLSMKSTPAEKPFTSEKAPPKMIRSFHEFNQRIVGPKLFDSVILPNAEGLTVANKK